MSQDLLTTLVPYIVPVIITFAVSLAAAMYQHILRWLPPNQRDMLEYAVKKHEAEIRVREILQTFHMTVPTEIIDTSVEAAVHALNSLGNQAPAPPTGSIANQDTSKVPAAQTVADITTAKIVIAPITLSMRPGNETTYGGSSINRDTTVGPRFIGGTATGDQDERKYLVADLRKQ